MASRKISPVVPPGPPVGPGEPEINIISKKENIEMAIDTDFEGDTATRSWDANVKRTYDEYQDVALTAARRSQLQFDALNQRQAARLAELDNLSTQALQNAIESANMVAKQTVRHADLAVDHQWNIDEQANMATIIATTFSKHIAADHGGTSGMGLK